MIYIIHGENPVKAREQILTIQKKHNAGSRSEIDLLSTSPAQLREQLSSVGMFESLSFVVANIDGLHYTKYQQYADAVLDLPEHAILILFSNKELSPGNVFIKNSQKLKAQTIFVSPLISSNVFAFLDALYNKKRETAYSEIEKLKNDGHDDFYIFSMILYGLRNVANAKFDSPSFAKVAPFVKSKALSQAKLFSERDLSGLFTKMYKIDKDVKTGALSQDLFVTVAIEKILEKSNT